MDDGEIKFLGDLQRLQPQPGDVFVLSMDSPLSMQQVETVRQYWRTLMGDAPLLVLDGGTKLGVIAKAALPAQEG